MSKQQKQKEEESGNQGESQESWPWAGIYVLCVKGWNQYNEYMIGGGLGGAEGGGGGRSRG